MNGQVKSLKLPSTITVRQVRVAFWRTFHDAGEYWFGGEKDDAAYKWTEFIDNLKDVIAEEQGIARGKPIVLDGCMTTEAKEAAAVLFDDLSSKPLPDSVERVSVQLKRKQ